MKKAYFRYGYHWVASNYTNLKAMGRGVRGDLNSNLIKSFPIPIPEMGRQVEIARTLDSFQTLTMDLSSGLPAEISARRKQYEYYRDKLLTFKDLS